MIRFFLSTFRSFTSRSTASSTKNVVSTSVFCVRDFRCAQYLVDFYKRAWPLRGKCLQPEETAEPAGGSHRPHPGLSIQGTGTRVPSPPRRAGGVRLAGAAPPAQPRAPPRLLPPTHFPRLCSAQDSENVALPPPGIFSPQPDVPRSRCSRLARLHRTTDPALRLLRTEHQKCKRPDNVRIKSGNHWGK